MADFKSPQPIKTKDATGGDVQTQIGDGGGTGDLWHIDASNRGHVKSDIQIGGSDVSSSNPLPTSGVASPCKADDYSESVSVAAAAKHTHSYSPGATELFTGLIVGASGCVKIEISWGTTASEVKKVEYFTTPSQPSASIMLPCGITIPATDSVKVEVTNTDTDPFDISTTIFTE